MFEFDEDEEVTPPDEEEAAEPEEAEPPHVEEQVDWRARYRESSQEAQRLHADLQRERESARQAAERERQALQAMAYRPQDPQQTDRHREKLAETGIDPDTIASFVEQRAQQIVERKLAETLTPFVQSAQASMRADLEMPEFAANKNEIFRFLQENPDAQQRYQTAWNADPTIAARLATLEWKQVQAARQEQEMLMNSQEHEGRKARERAHAQPIRSKSGREATKVTAEQSQLAKEKAAWERWQQTGDENALAAYRNLRLKSELDDVLGEE